ncbi:MAG TPA: sialidase family protein [Verrucomicrobiae bacterium]
MIKILKTFFPGAIMALVVATGAAAEPQFSDVFVAGQDGFPAIRIPSVVVTKSGTVLALAEGRTQIQADQANNKLILKRSTDGGRTWGARQTIADDGNNCLNNPCTVVDQQTGRILVMFQSYPAGHSERDGTILPGLTGPAIVRNCVITSDDDGLTWSKPQDVTRTTKHCGRVTIVASGPGLGLQLQHGAHKNRIIIPFNEGPFGQWNVLAVFSDDGGKNWELGEPAPGGCVTNAAGKITSLVNEVQMVELSDGSVMLNSRKWGGQARRKIAVSHDGGMTWSKIAEEPALRDPGCMASIFSYSFPGTGEKNCLLYSGPDSDQRANGTIRASYDDGKTWPVHKVLVPGSFAYSALTELPDGTVGCLFETDGTDRLVFARFPLAWLTGDANSTAK